MKCKDCIHNLMCYLTHTDDSPACCNFKNAADVVEVRCKECRHFKHEFDGVGHCQYAGIDLDHMETGFCSYGERRSE